MKKGKKEKSVTPIPTAEMNDCCKIVAQIKDRDLERAVTAVKAEAQAFAEQFQDRIEELEKLAFIKARAVSGLEGEIVSLKHKLAMLEKVDVHVRMPPLKVTPVVVTPASPAPPTKTVDPDKLCVVCKREAIGMCPECGRRLCDRQSCGQMHGHGDMWR